MICDAYFLYLLCFVTSTMRAATLSNSYVKWRLRDSAFCSSTLPILNFCPVELEGC